LLKRNWNTGLPLGTRVDFEAVIASETDKSSFDGAVKRLDLCTGSFSLGLSFIACPSKLTLFFFHYGGMQKLVGNVGWFKKWR